MLPFMLWGLILSAKEVVSRKGKWFLNLIFSSEGLLMLFAVIYSAIHLLTWALIRYRLPVDAVLIPFAGLAVANLIQRMAVWHPTKVRGQPE